jgi:hypothetical protein
VEKSGNTTLPWGGVVVFFGILLQMCKNWRMVPQCIIYTNTEAEKAERGALKWAVNLLAGMFAFGWTDGNHVHMFSYVDG